MKNSQEPVAANTATSEASPQPLEIERKFIVKHLPENLGQYKHAEIRQGYLAITQDGTEVRLRQKGDKYYQTVKKGSGKVRFESEVEITKDQFESQWMTTEGRRVEKTRYEIPHESGTIELDIYHGTLEGLLSAEMEFLSEDASNRFTAPEWLGEEVTENADYKNQNLALHGLPKIKPLRQGKIEETLGVPEYETEEGLNMLISLISDKLKSSAGRPIVVEIAGGSASGKTYKISDEVMKKFGSQAVLIPMDDYYRGATFMQQQAAQGVTLNWDQPEALDIPLLKQHLAQLKKGEGIEKPMYRIKPNAESIGNETVKPAPIIVIEGLFALSDELAQEGDVKAFVETGVHGRIIRRLLRDIERTNQKPADILKYFSEVVQPMHDKYIQSTKQNADLVISSEYKPQIEAQRAKIYELQLKFPGTIDTTLLQKLGAEKLSSTVQIDHYYNPASHNLAKTDEMLRIREESGLKLLSYKGPKIESSFRRRPKFEFEIDNETEDKFISLYGDQFKVIKKQRTLYKVQGVVLSLDNVFAVDGEQERSLGQFIEIRSIEDDQRGELGSAIEKLGLNFSDGTKESYIEIAGVQDDNVR